MKRLPIYTGICIALFIISLILPYEKYDRYSGGLFSPSRLAEVGVYKSGMEIPAVFIPLVAMAIIAFIVLIKRNLATGITGFILGFFLVLFMALLGAILTMNLSIFGGPRNEQLQLGYFVGLFAIISYSIVLLVNLIAIVRNKKQENQKPAPHSMDLLDIT